MQSQRWMFTSPGGEDEYKRLSITKEHYAAKNPEKPVESVSDRKKRLLENLIWKKMTENALSQMNNQNVYVDRMQVMRSTYTESFVKEGFVPKELGTEIDEKLQEKYPLYTDMGKSIHLRKIHEKKAKDAVHKPYSKIFRRDSRFTERLNNPLDIHEPVKPGHFAYV